MNEQTFLEVVKGGISLGSSTISAIVGALLTTIFLRNNTEITEFKKIQQAKFWEVKEDLLKQGKISYLEYFKCSNFLKIAKKADEVYQATPKEDAEEKKEYEFDWFVKFYEHASSISNEEMQALWASIFAREAAEPGNISLSLLNALSLMSKSQAQLFCNISRFALRDVDYSPILLLFVSTNREAYEKSRITPEQLKELQRLGLIDCDFNNEFIFFNKKVLKMGNRVITIYGDPENDNRIKAGNVTFTKDGMALYAVIDDAYKQYRSDILDFTVVRFKHRNCRVIINGRDV